MGVMVYLAALETSNFEFEAIGDTSETALELFEGAWLRHHVHNGQLANMLSFDSLLEGCDKQRLAGYAYQVGELQVGQTWLDGACLEGWFLRGRLRTASTTGEAKMTTMSKRTRGPSP